jgi:hypothetical protein
MKEWFSHKDGYVNIDEENVYLSRTGVWSEVRLLPERSKQSKRIDNYNKFKTYLFMTLAILSLASITVIIGKRFFTSKFWNEFTFAELFKATAFTVLPLLGIYFIRGYFAKETGPECKIPRSNIQKIAIDAHNKTIRMFVVDANGKEEEIVLSDVEEKGLIDSPLSAFEHK